MVNSVLHVPFLFLVKPKELLSIWVDFFNQHDYNGLSELYDKDCVNHQTPNGIIQGKE